MLVRLSVRMEQFVSPRTDFREILYLRMFKKSVEKIQVLLQLTRIKDTLHEIQYTLFIISRSFLLTMRNVSDKSCRENQNIFCVQ